jgi:hypothetical protein
MEDTMSRTRRLAGRFDANPANMEVFEAAICQQFPSASRSCIAADVPDTVCDFRVQFDRQGSTVSLFKIFATAYYHDMALDFIGHRRSLANLPQSYLLRCPLT